VTVGELTEVIDELARRLNLVTVVPTGLRIADHRGSGTTRPVVGVWAGFMPPWLAH
jgi:hypothetical protein